VSCFHAILRYRATPKLNILFQACVLSKIRRYSTIGKCNTLTPLMSQHLDSHNYYHDFESPGAEKATKPMQWKLLVAPKEMTVAGLSGAILRQWGHGQSAARLALFNCPDSDAQLRRPCCNHVLMKDQASSLVNSHCQYHYHS